MFTPKTSHQLAKELLALPDLPVECCAADSGGYDVTDHGTVITFKVINNEYIFIHAEEMPDNTMFQCEINTYRNDSVPEYRKQTMMDKVKQGYFN